MDPDFRGAANPVVNVDGQLKDTDDNVEGFAVSSVYSLDNPVNEVKIFSFDPSFIGEQVNASIQALPNDVVRHSYVHTVYNYDKDRDEIFIYPSMGVPLFVTNHDATSQSLEAGEVGTG